MAEQDDALDDPALNAHALGGQLLIASPVIQDSHFAVSVIYLCEANEHGALGFTLNRPLPAPRASAGSRDAEGAEAPARFNTVDRLFDTMGIPCDNPTLENRYLLSGGPVHPESGFVLHSPVGEWKSMPVNERVGINNSRAMLESISSGCGPENIQILLGCARWGPGQLEDEIAANAWLVLDEDLELIFRTPPDEIWTLAVQRLDWDWDKLSRGAGHA